MSDGIGKNKKYPVQIDDAKLASEIDQTSFEVLRHGATERPLLANIQTAKKLAVIDARPAITNYLRVKQSFTLDVVGHLFMPQLKMMQLN